MLRISGQVLSIDLKDVVSRKRKSCALSMATGVLKAIDTDLPFPGLNLGNYFVYLPETRKRKIR